ncbi:CsbD family protein [Streptomyces sp. YC504]|uniref:CsbD family protein n=1 Tax=Streptomyces mesophilus TaxID=1775132 RepID=A0A6G4XDV7_9ACTN|nr:CsbD family protein [Streptomyces mesophilus]NGO75729.1 CsbD family protein [Streptomyces mesophilus]
MSANEKAKAKTDQAVGAAKKNAGRVVGNDRLADEGRAQQVKGDAREAKEKTKDVGKH